MKVHSFSPSELHATAQTRADEVAITEVPPSALQAVTGGATGDPVKPAGLAHPFYNPHGVRVPGPTVGRVSYSTQDGAC